MRTLLLFALAALIGTAAAQAPPLTLPVREESKAMRVAAFVVGATGLAVIAYHETTTESRREVRYDPRSRTNLHLLVGGSMVAVGFSLRVLATPPKPARLRIQRR